MVGAPFGIFETEKWADTLVGLFSFRFVPSDLSVRKESNVVDESRTWYSRSVPLSKKNHRAKERMCDGPCAVRFVRFSLTCGDHLGTCFSTRWRCSSATAKVAANAKVFACLGSS